MNMSYRLGDHLDQELGDEPTPPSKMLPTMSSLPLPPQLLTTTSIR